MNTSDRPIVVFDAVCPLCTANARFILRHDCRATFRLASMQSEAGAGLYRRFGIDPANPVTLVLVLGDQALRNSDAVLGIWQRLGWPWRAAGVFRLVPRVLRDAVYLWVARNRYRLFGRRDICWLPTANYRDRLL